MAESTAAGHFAAANRCPLGLALLSALALLVPAATCGAGPLPPPLSPVILVPGLGGTTIKARLQGAHAAQPWCSSTTREWFTTWPHLGQFMPYQKECMVSRMEVCAPPPLAMPPPHPRPGPIPADAGLLQRLDR